MAVIEIKNLKFSYADEELYNGLNFQLNHFEHATLVGPNGSGKSTFMKLLCGKLTPDQGEVKWLNGIKYSYLDQQLEVNTDETLYNFLYDIYRDLYEKENEMNKLYTESINLDPESQEKALMKAESIRLELENDDFYNIDTLINNVIVGLGLNKHDPDTKLKTLSGGERAKAYLGKILLQKPDVILMDEPTNFLDKVHIEWLENYLNNFKGAFLIISHDKEFLKSISKIVFAIENKTINKYKGDYDFYLKERVVRYDQQLKNYKKQQELIKRTEIFIEKNIARASTTRMAQSRRKFLEKLDRIEKPETERTIKIRFPFSRELGDNVLKIEDLEIGYNDIPLLEKFNYKMERGDKIEIIGKNGVGKTTLIKTLLGIIPKISGNYTFGPSVEINYFSQEEDLDLTMTPIDYVRQFYPLKTLNEVMKILSPLGINGELAQKSFSALSGGEMERVRLSILTTIKSNFLILDEPTNHLDKNTKEALAEAIDEFRGSVIIVSHEKGFADDLVDYIIKL